jgi:SNF2 family DNA or RNA helicase
MIDNFQNGNVSPIMIISLKAGGTGLNLTAATNVIHYDLWWNPAVEAQATDRTYRIGQSRKVIVHRLITISTFEEKIDEMISAKKRVG